MLKKFKIKKAGALMLSIMMLGTSVPAVVTAETAVPQAAQAASDTSFDAETVMWTNRTIEEVLAQTGKYKTVQEVDPNAAKSTDALNIQTPYGKPGEYYQSWAYSEFIWTNYYPIGNGRMAGMVAGGIDNEVVQINEDTCWDGSPYGTLEDEQGNTISTMKQANDTSGKILGTDMTSGTRKDGWKFYRGANADGTPAEIGSADAIVGDETFRTNYPDFANKSISNQSLAVDNSSSTAAVQKRFDLANMVEGNFLGVPSGQRAYKSFVELYLDFGHKSADASNYKKSLDMKNGIVTVEYDCGGGHYKRENFASYPDQVVATHIESDKELDFSAKLHTYHNESGYCTYEKISDKEVKVKAAVTNGNKDNNIGRINVIKFESRMYLDGDGTFTVSEDNSTVSVKGGKSATVYVVGATNYVDYKTLDNAKPSKDCEYYMNNVKSKTYADIKARHIADFEAEFNKSSLSLANSGKVSDYGSTPTEKRVRKDLSSGKSGFTAGTRNTLSDAKKVGVTSTYTEGDNQLAVLMFNYGKYLIIAGARDKREASGSGEIDIAESQPLNLTGKWNAAMSASWNGKYTININTEMNYWAAQPLNIGETERTLIDSFDDLAESGAITAAEQYGIYNERNDGTYQPGDPWVMHHNYDLWRGTQPIDNATAGLWPTGGAWLLDHAWQYYQFNKDKEYLAEVYPYMVGAAKFFTQFLIVDPNTGYLITAASCSPEQGSVQPGPAMDTQLVRNLYDMVQQASKILGKEAENADLLAKIAKQMPSSYLADEKGKIAPNLIDKDGYIKEWVRGDVTFDFSEKKDTSGKYQVTNPFNPNDEIKSISEHSASNHNGHRHCSHLWELYPGTHLSAYSSDANEQKLIKSFAKTVSARGVGDRSWAYAWRMALNARALNGEAADTSLETLITTKTSPNMFTQHPNFQIDGNYGATAAIAEMLIQSHDGAVTLLPAIPDTWASGSLSGINTREGAVIDLSWNGGKPETAKLHVTESGDKNIRSQYMSEAKVYDESGKEVETTLNDDRTVLTFSAEAGKTYTINNFGTNVTEGNRVYKANEVTEFYASDGGTVPKVDGNGVDIGYIYNRENVKIGYAISDFDFEGLRGITLNMAKVRKSDTYVSVTVDKPDGTEIANQIISTGDNELTLKNIDGISGTHKIYVLYYRNPYANDDKYIGNAGNITASYSKTSPTPASYSYSIESAAYDANANLNIDVKYTGSGSDKTAQLVIASYDKDGVLISTDTSKTLNGTEKVVLNYAPPADGGTMKVFIWNSLQNMQPLSEAKDVSIDMPEQSAAPSSAPSAAPSAKPSSAPAETGVYIGDTKYETVTAAVAAAEAKNPSSEAERVTIDVMPGVYREQVRVTKPYITIQKKPGTSGETKLTWYYGLGSLYDSCNADGYYDPSVIGDGEAYGPKDWGPSLKVDKGATGFIAKDIYLENSYNAYYTEEELTDIKSIDPDKNNSNFPRVDWIKAQKASGVSDDEINAYLQSRKDITYGGYTGSPRERSAALHCSADKAQFINCTVMSTQDTIGINSGRMYFKNCKLGGTTDYICGSATAVFDGCELYTNSGPKQGESATITAPSNTKESEGYLFWNCKITGSSTATAGNLGRPWGAAPGPAAYYINTTIGKNLISPSGWSDMSGNKAEDARFGEYGSVDTSGNAVDTSKRTKGKVLNDWTMLRYNPYTFTKGSDGWDPAGLASGYTNVEKVISETTIDTSDSTTNEIALPAAPSGYEYNWESDSEFAVVNGSKLELVRPAVGEQPIKASVKLYVRESANKVVGAEKSIDFDIQPTNDTTNVFTVSGTVNLSVASDEVQTVNIEFKKGKAVIKSVNVIVDANTTSKAYTAENIPVGTYTVVSSIANAEYNIADASAEVTGAKGETKTFDVSAKKMNSIKAESVDFDNLTAVLTTAEGFSAGVYTATGSETANLGEAGNKVYKLTKDEGKKVAAKTGVSFDIKSLLPSGATLNNTKTIKVGYDFLMESVDLLPSDYSYFDLATSKTNAGADKADMSRFVRWGVHKSWKQINMFNSQNARINGDNTQFDKNSTMANKWYRITAEIDLDNKTVTSTLCNRDNSMEILNKKPFIIAAPDDEGNSPNYPTGINLDNLYFNIYMDKKGDTTNKLEYYIDNITLEYQDYE